MKIHSLDIDYEMIERGEDEYTNTIVSAWEMGSVTSGLAIPKTKQPLAAPLIPGNSSPADLNRARYGQLLQGQHHPRRAGRGSADRADQPQPEPAY